MERNPKRSRALIITTIIVLALLIGVYFLFSNKDQLFGTQGSLSTNKLFSPFLGTPKQSSVTPIETKSNTNEAPISENTQKDETNQKQDTASVPEGVNQERQTNNGTENSVLNPLPIPERTSDPEKLEAPQPGAVSRACNDKIDNDKDGLVDNRDPGCHTDFDSSYYESYDPTINDESRDIKRSAPNDPKKSNPKLCPATEQDPLVFTAEEKAQLRDLLRQFYRIAPFLKTQDDVTIEKGSAKSYQDVINEAGELYDQCVTQKANPAYTGPQEVKNNPYYQQTTGNSRSFLEGMEFTYWTNKSPQEILGAGGRINPENMAKVGTQQPGQYSYDYSESFSFFEEQLNIW